MPRVLVRPDEAAAALSVSRRTVYRLIDTGKLQTVTLGSSRRFVVWASVEKLGKLS